MTDRPAGTDGIAEYQKVVDQALSDLCGVTYSTLVIDMAPDMDRYQALLKAGAARQVEPKDFARAFQRAHKLALCSNSGREWAEQFNLSRAALISFGSEGRGWQIGTDGRAYRAVDGSRLLRVDIANRGDKWGFAVSESVGPSFVTYSDADPLRRVSPPDGAFEKLSVRMDIGDAVAAAIRLRNQRKLQVKEQPALSAPAPQLPAMGMA